MDLQLLWIALGFVLTNILIDSIKFCIIRDAQSSIIYIIDQLVHLVSLWGLALMFSKVSIYPQVIQFFNSAGLSFYMLLKNLLFFLIILKPANTTFKYMLRNLSLMIKTMKIIKALEH